MDPSLPPPLLPSEPSVLILEATLVEELLEVLVYEGVQILDEGPGPWWSRHVKFIIGAMCVSLVTRVVGFGTWASSNDKRIGFVGEFDVNGTEGGLRAKLGGEDPTADCDG